MNVFVTAVVIFYSILTQAPFNIFLDLRCKKMDIK